MDYEGNRRRAWKLRINDSLLEIDQWFCEHGDDIPEGPRQELETSLMNLSENIDGYARANAPIPVHAVGQDAELAKRAEQRREGRSRFDIILIVGWALVAIIAAALAFFTPARADEAHIKRYHADEAYSEWLTGLIRPDVGGSCCNLNDCEETVAEWRDGQWYAIVRGHWRAIPANKVVDDNPAPDGKAYVCAAITSPAAAPNAQIYCFVPEVPGF